MRELWQWDQDGVRLLNRDLRAPWLDPLVRGLTETGLFHWQVAALLLLALVPSLRRGAWAAIWAGSLAGVLNLIPREIIERWRPGRFEGFVDRLDTPVLSPAYPSGHTATSFGLAFMVFFITLRTPQAWVGWVALVYAALVGLSRVYVGVHWPTDVIGGIGSGMMGAAGFLLLARWRGWLGLGAAPSPEGEAKEVP